MTPVSDLPDPIPRHDPRRETVAQVVALVEADPGITQAELADLTNVTRSRITRILGTAQIKLLDRRRKEHKR